MRLFADRTGLLAEWTGLEPATPCVTGMYSNQLNYHSVWDGKYTHHFLLHKLFFKKVQFLLKKCCIYIKNRFFCFDTR